MKSKQLPNIFEYIDYRKYLSDYYHAKKAQEPGFSHTYICYKLRQEKSKTYFSNIISGRRAIGPTFIDRFIDFLELKDDEAKYFRALVSYNQTMSPKEKEFFFDQLVRLNRTPRKFIDEKSYEYFRDWHTSAIRSLLDVVDTDGDCTTLSRKLTIPLSLPAIKKAFQILKTLGLIQKDSKGYFKPTDRLVSTSDGIKDELIKRYQMACLEMGRQAIAASSPGAHKMSTLTMSWTSKQPSWGTPVTIDLTRLHILEFMVTVADNPGLEQSSGWYEIDDIKTIGFAKPANTAPSFTPGGNILVAEDAGPQSITWASAISAGDNGQTLTFLVSNDNTALFSTQPVISPATGALSFSSAPNANGIAHLAVVLRDNGTTAFCGKNISDTAKFSLTVNAVNDTPRITSTPADVSLEDSTYRYSVVCTDPDIGDTLIYTLDSCPDSMTISSTGQLQWKPGRDMVGKHTIVVKVTDRAGASATQTWELRIATTRSIAVSSPKNGDAWIAKSNVRIAWAIAGRIDSIDIMLSFDSCKTWSMLAKASAEKGELTFTVPDTVGNACRLRVQDAEDSLVADTSDGYFKIQPATGNLYGHRIPSKTGLTSLRYNCGMNGLSLGIALAKPELLSARFFSLQGRLLASLPERIMPVGYHTMREIRFVGRKQSNGPIVAYIKIGAMEVSRMVFIK